MSTIGVGKAFRDQDKEARRRRARSRDTFELVRGRRSEDHGQIEGSEVCADCGERVLAAEVLWTGGGPLCERCVRRAVADAPLPSATRGLSLVAWAGWLAVLVQVVAALTVRTGILIGGRDATGWVLFSGMVLVASVVALIDTLWARGGPEVALARGVAGAMVGASLLAALVPYLRVAAGG